MLDTVILSIPKHKVYNSDGTNNLRFEAQQQNSGKGYAKWVKNPSKYLLESGFYHPKLTGIKRFDDYFVKIEFSVPKLLYGNNVEELEQKDFEAVINTLHYRLLDMDIKISKEDLIEAKVLGIHFSKNILLQNGITARYVIKELAKTNKRKSFDNTDFRYSNDGQSLQMYSKSHSLVIYDKMLDIIKNEKRAVDKDNNKMQAGLFDELPKLTEIVRFEVRMTNSRKMKQVFDELGYKKELKFCNLFSEELSQKVVNLYWKKVMQNSEICHIPVTEPKQLLDLICIKFPAIKPLKKLQYVGMCMLAKDERGLTELRSILFSNMSDRTWYRLAAEFKELGKALQTHDLRDWIKQIEVQLTNYKKINIQIKKI